MGDEKDRRILLDSLIKEAVDCKVYFEPPENFKMEYPCVVYNRKRGFAKYADNKAYMKKILYEITVIDKNPDSPFPQKIWELDGISRENSFVHDNLHHDVFNIYF